MIRLPDHTLDSLNLRTRTCQLRFVVHHLSFLDQGAQTLIDHEFNFARFILCLAIITPRYLLWRRAFENVRLAS